MSGRKSVSVMSTGRKSVGGGSTGRKSVGGGSTGRKSVGGGSWTDVFSSAELHLELFVEDLAHLSSSASLTKADEVLLLQTLDQLSYVFSFYIAGRLKHMSPDLCERLLSVLLEFTGLTERKFFDVVPTNAAIRALRCFAGFLFFVDEFMVAVEERDVMDLKTRLQLKRHLHMSKEDERRFEPSHSDLSLTELEAASSANEKGKEMEVEKEKEIVGSDDVSVSVGEVDGSSKKHHHHHVDDGAESDTGSSTSSRSSIESEAFDDHRWIAFLFDRALSPRTGSPEHPDVDAELAHRDVAAAIVLFLSKYSKKFMQIDALVSSDAVEICQKRMEFLEKEGLFTQHDISLATRVSVYPPKGSYFDFSPDRLLSVFSTNADTGLTSKDAKNRKEFYGGNRLPPKKKVEPFKILFRQLTDLIVLILMAACVLSAVIGDFKSSVVLALVIVVNATIGFVQEYKAEKAICALSSLEIPQTSVLRDGMAVNVDADDLVPGDIVLLEEGSYVPADLRVISCSDLEVIETVLTGESVAVKKSIDAIKVRSLPALADRKNMAFMSTVVAKGNAKAIVVKTGITTEVGRIAASLSDTKVPLTPLQRQLHRLSKYLVVISLIACSLVVVAGLAHGSGSEIIRTAVSLAVSVMPEGLVTVVTLTLAAGMRRMAKSNALVRNLPSVEVLGSCQTLCSDKTGTLTTGKMTVTEWFPKEPSFILRLCATLCNNAHVSWDSEHSKTTDSSGDATEVALLVDGLVEKDVRNVFLIPGVAERKREVAFDSERKRMSVVYQFPGYDGDYDVLHASKTNGSFVVLSKGAPEEILHRCTTSRLTREGEVDMSDQERERIFTEMENLSSSGLRVLAFACKTLASDFDVENADAELIEKDLCLLGLIGLWDPPRDAVYGAIEQCHSSGIDVCMITGDSLPTAVSIGAKIGLFRQFLPADSISSVLPSDFDYSKYVMHGSGIGALSVEQLAELDPFPVLFSRVSPDQKLKIVKALQMKKRVTGFIGDGVNDAAAIAAANIGISVGSACSLVKEVADMILLDDNFATIVVAIREGRRVVDNIRNFLHYLLSCNSAEVIAMIAVVSSGWPAVMTAPMILAANIFADIPGSLALGAEPAELDVMRRPPRDPEANILSVRDLTAMSFEGGVMSVFTVAAFLWAFLGDFRDESLPYSRAFAFSLLCSIQIIHMFSCRHLSTPIFRIPAKIFWKGNPYVFFAWFVSMGFLFLCLYVPGMNTLVDLVPLEAMDWVFILISMILMVFFVESFKTAILHWWKAKACEVEDEDHENGSNIV